MPRCARAQPISTDAADGSIEMETPSSSAGMLPSGRLRGPLLALREVHGGRLPSPMLSKPRLDCLRNFHYWTRPDDGFSGGFLRVDDIDEADAVVLGPDSAEPVTDIASQYE